MKFLDFKHQILMIIDDLNVFLENVMMSECRHTDVSNSLIKLNQIKSKIEKESFHIGVFGGFNSGKSSLLNAMVKRTVLSTFVLPTTSATTKLSYGEEEYADVVFWSISEWEKIKLDAEERRFTEPSLIDTITQQEEQIGAEIIDLIKDPPVLKKIKLDDISMFNTNKGRYSIFVREVNIYVKTNFFRDNICIIDTPGINDPIAFRDYITKIQSPSTCDLILFLTPAGQAFSKSDESFIIEQTQLGHLNKVFFILNKIDQIDQSELAETIDFAKKSMQYAIKKALPADTKNPNIEVFPISAKQALAHRCPRKDFKPIMSLEQTGIEYFEECLRSFLFQGERTQMLIYSLREKLIHGVFAPIRKLLSKIVSDDIGMSNIYIEINRSKDLIDSIDLSIAKHDEYVSTQMHAFSQEIDTVVDSFRSSINRLGNDIYLHAINELKKYLKNPYEISTSIAMPLLFTEEMPLIIERELIRLIEIEKLKSLDSIPNKLKSKINEIRSKKDYHCFQYSSTKFNMPLSAIILTLNSTLNIIGAFGRKAAAINIFDSIFNSFKESKINDETIGIMAIPLMTDINRLVENRSEHESHLLEEELKFFLREIETSFYIDRKKIILNKDLEMSKLIKMEINLKAKEDLKKQAKLYLDHLNEMSNRINNACS